MKFKVFHFVFNRRNWHGNMEFEYKYDFPFSHLAQERGREYKYWIVKNKEKDRKELWECYMRNGHSGEYVNRILNIPNQLKGSALGKGCLPF